MLFVRPSRGRLAHRPNLKRIREQPARAPTFQTMASSPPSMRAQARVRVIRSQDSPAGPHETGGGGAAATAAASGDLKRYHFVSSGATTGCPSTASWPSWRGSSRGLGVSAVASGAGHAAGPGDSLPGDARRNPPTAAALRRRAASPRLASRRRPRLGTPRLDGGVALLTPPNPLATVAAPTTSPTSHPRARVPRRAQGQRGLPRCLRHARARRTTSRGAAPEAAPPLATGEREAGGSQRVEPLALLVPPSLPLLPPNELDFSSIGTIDQTINRLDFLVVICTDPDACQRVPGVALSLDPGASGVHPTCPLEGRSSKAAIHAEIRLRTGCRARRAARVKSGQTPKSRTTRPPATVSRVPPTPPTIAAAAKIVRRAPRRPPGPLDVPAAHRRGSPRAAASSWA